MRVLLFICLLSAGVFAQNRDIFFIDDFVANTPPQIIQIPNNPSFPISRSVSTQSDSIFGGERDIFLQANSGNPQLLLTAGVSGGNYTAATPNGARGFSTLTYDGSDNSNTLNPMGLGGANFRAEGGFAFRTTFRSDTATTVTFQVYSGSLHNVCSTTINVPANNVDQQYILRFDNDFSNGCDFSQVGALVVTFDQPDNVDIIMQLISVYAPIPQSASTTPTQTRTRTPAPGSQSNSPTPSLSNTPSTSASSTTTRSSTSTDTPTTTSTPSYSSTGTPTTSSTLSTTNTPSCSVTSTKSPSSSSSSTTYNTKHYSDSRSSTSDQAAADSDKYIWVVWLALIIAVTFSFMIVVVTVAVVVVIFVVRSPRFNPKISENNNLEPVELAKYHGALEPNSFLTSESN